MGADQFIEQPIFICGHRRSGTTLILSLLENHPQLLVYPPDSGFFYAYYPVYEEDKYSDRDRIDQIVNFSIGNLEELLATLSDAAQDEINFPFDEFRKAFIKLATKGAANSKELLKALILAYKSVYDHPQNPVYWVEKTTSSEIYAAEAQRWFPAARFIHIVRDPRDNWASLKSGWDVRFKYHNDSLDRLMHSMIERGSFGFQLALQNPRRIGEGAYKVIRYEDLVTDTEMVMRDVCEFLGIYFHETLLSPTVCGKLWAGNNYSGDNFTHPSTQNVGRWDKRITEEEAQLLEFHFEEFMRAFGYRQSYSLSERTDAAVNHYKWYNYAQAYSFLTTQNVQPQRKKK